MLQILCYRFCQSDFVCISVIRYTLSSILYRHSVIDFVTVAVFTGILCVV